MKSDIINARVEPHLKHAAEKIFRSLGMTTTHAISIFLSQVVLNEGLPFPVKMPNRTTRKAVKELREGKGSRFASVDEMMEHLGQ